MSASAAALVASLGILVVGLVILVVKVAHASARTAVASALFSLSQIAIVGFLAVIILAAGDAYPLGVSMFVLVMSVLCVIANACLARAAQDALTRGDGEARIRMLEERVDDLRAREEALARQARRAQAARRRMADELVEAERLLDEARASEAVSHAAHALELLGGSEEAGGLCEHPVIDALLARKRDACAAEGVRFEAQVGVPADIGLPTPALVAAFANALDNAIASCARSSAHDRFVRVRARMEAGYLVITVRNTCDDAAADIDAKAGVKRGVGALLRAAEDGSMPAHGWGTGIMRDLAVRYGGLYRAQCKDGVFDVRMVLKAERSS